MNRQLEEMAKPVMEQVRKLMEDRYGICLGCDRWHNLGGLTMGCKKYGASPGPTIQCPLFDGHESEPIVAVAYVVRRGKRWLHVGPEGDPLWQELLPEADILADRGFAVLNARLSGGEIYEVTMTARKENEPNKEDDE
jgi:hypothetical protein